MLALSRKEGESIRLGRDVEIHVAAIRGNKVCLRFKAPRSVRIVRSELEPAIEEDHWFDSQCGGNPLDRVDSD
jgi:carbon storage regulator